MAAVYSREIDGTVLTISASGWTYNRLFVLYDYETESVWYDMSDGLGLTCVAGPYEGRKLSERESFHGSWKDWKRFYPKTLFYKPSQPPRRPGG